MQDTICTFISHDVYKYICINCVWVRRYVTLPICPSFCPSDRILRCRRRKSSLGPYSIIISECITAILFFSFFRVHAHSGGGGVARAWNKSKSSDVPPQTVFFLSFFRTYIYICPVTLESSSQVDVYIYMYIVYTCPRHIILVSCIYHRTPPVDTFVIAFFPTHFLHRSFSRDLMICTISLLGPSRSNAAHRSGDAATSSGGGGDVSRVLLIYPGRG